MILTGKDDSIGGQRQQLVDEWNKAHPDSPARLDEVSSNADQQYSAMVAQAQSDDSSVDVYNLDVTWTAEFAAAHFILSLDRSTNLSGFLDKPLETCRYNGKLWALPFNTDAGLLYYRTDLVRSPALSQLPPSTSDIGKMAATDQVKAWYAGQLAPYEGLTVNVLEAIWAAGGDVLDGNNRVVIDSDGAKVGLQRLARGLVVPPGSPGQLPAMLRDSTEFDERKSTDAFRKGEVVLMRNWPVAYGQLRDDPGSAVNVASQNFAVTQLPGSSVLGGQNLAIASKTRKPRAAKALIEFLTSESSQRRLFQDGGLAATRGNIYNEPPVLDARPYAGVLLAALKDARPRPLTTHYALFSRELQRIVMEALDNDGALPNDAVSRLTASLKGQLYPR